MMHQKNNSTHYNRYPEIFNFCSKIKDGCNLDVLSFGCSNGDEIQSLKDLYFVNARIDGVDINVGYVNSCKERFGESNNILSYNEFINQSKTYDVIFVMSVLCKWEDTEFKNDCSKIYPFYIFDNCVKLLYEKLNLGGILVVYNSNFRMSDSSHYKLFKPIVIDEITESGFVHKFNSNNQKIENNYNEVIFRKESTNLKLITKKMTNYSQNNEQEAILNYFSKNINASGHGGKYIEIGSYDPFKFSNTRALFEMGWKGVLVEPSPICFARLKKEYENELRIKLINAAIMPNDGTISFQDCSGDAIGTTDLAHKDKWERGAGIQYHTITAEGIGMQRFMNENGADTDFLSLDTEGTNYELFNLLPNDFLHRLKAICIEHDGFNIQMMDKLSGFGFKQVLFNDENLIAVK